jgi:peptide/nickel transport system ATP-binding protein
MTEDDFLLRIEDLYVNFYTYQGVVKALDGISLDLRRGETFGLVGETGCGKSVTANSILRLIPSPPGKIEKGRIYFHAPNGNQAEIDAINERIEKLSADQSTQSSVEEMKSLNDQLNEINSIRTLKQERAAALEHESNGDASRVKEIDEQLMKILSRYDLLSRSLTYMRRIRGKHISMIFQEPMSALNPVFPSGDQIAEVLLQHERKECAQAVVKIIAEDLKAIDQFKRATRTKTAKGEWQCSNCQANMAEEIDHCPECKASFGSDSLKSLRKLKLRYYQRFYKKIVTQPDAFGLRVASRIPVVRRYEKLLRKEGLNRAERMLRLVRIPDPKNVSKSYPYELSGGMQQRVMIAMALACKPSMLIADEPTTALDVTIQAQILKLMKDLQEETGTTILLITHNLGVVAETCDRVGVMYAGAMAEIGSANAIFKEPLHPYTQGLMDSIPKMKGQNERLEAIEGSVPNLVKPPSGCRFNPRCSYAMSVCKERKPPMIEVKPGHFTACYLYYGVKQ